MAAFAKRERTAIERMWPDMAVVGREKERERREEMMVEREME